MKRQDKLILNIFEDEVHKKLFENVFIVWGRYSWAWSNKNVIGCTKKKCRRKAFLFKKPRFIMQNYAGK